MSQIIITGTPRFEDVKFLVDMLPESDRQTLKNYLLSLDDGNWEKEFDELLSRFRSHYRSDEEIEQDVKDAIREARNARKNSSIRKVVPNAFADGIEGVVVRPLKVNFKN